MGKLGLVTGFAGYGWRGLAPGLVAAALSACASTPAPIANWPDRQPPPFVYQGPDPIDPYAPPRILADAPPVQCVPFARSASGIEIYGDANTWWSQAAGRYPQSNQPAPGSVLVLRGYADATRGHVAVVTAIVSERVIRVDHANWLNQGETSLSVPVMDVSAANDWSEVKVWYIPGDHWGGRNYQVEGFIHPFLLENIS
jgi:hypothetical protein